MSGLATLPVGKRVLIYFLIVLVQIISAAYTVLTRDALCEGKADPLVFSLYRDILAFPLLYLWAFLAEHLNDRRKCCRVYRKENCRTMNSRAESFTSERSERLMHEEALKAAETFRRHKMCPRCVDIPRFVALGITGMFGNQVRGTLVPPAIDVAILLSHISS